MIQAKVFVPRSIAFGALLMASAASHAVPILYTSLATFNAATTSRGVDTFTSVSTITSTPSPIVRTAGSYGYTGTVSTSSFFGAGTVANPWLSTNTATDSMTFGSFTGGVGAIGGNFFDSDINGAFAAGDITISATDSTGTSTFTIVGATLTSFIGFVSSGLMTSMTVTAVQPAATFVWPTVDNLTLGLAAVAAPVPEAETYALMLLGLGAVGVMRRRRRA